MHPALLVVDEIGYLSVTITSDLPSSMNDWMTRLISFLYINGVFKTLPPVLRRLR